MSGYGPLFGPRLRALRISRDLSLEGAARRLREHGLPIDRAALSRIERNKRDFPASWILAISRAYEVELLAIVVRPDDPQLTPDLDAVPAQSQAKVLRALGRAS